MKYRATYSQMRGRIILKPETGQWPIPLKNKKKRQFLFKIYIYVFRQSSINLVTMNKTFWEEPIAYFP
jgi:hypothetical protein